MDNYVAIPPSVIGAMDDPDPLTLDELYPYVWLSTNIADLRIAGETGGLQIAEKLKGRMGRDRVFRAIKSLEARGFIRREYENVRPNSGAKRIVSFELTAR